MSSPTKPLNIIHFISVQPNVIQWLGEFASADHRKAFHWSDCRSLLHKDSIGSSDIILWDLKTSSEDIFGELQLLTSKFAGVGIAMIGDSVSSDLILRITRSGLARFIPTPASADELNMELESVFRYYQELDQLMREFDELWGRHKGIKERELDVLVMTCDGKPNRTIAARLNVSIRTIETCRQRIYRRMNVHSLAELIKVIDRIELLREILSRSVLRQADYSRFEGPHLMLREPFTSDGRLSNRSMLASLHPLDPSAES